MDYNIYTWLSSGDVYWTHGRARSDTPEAAIMRMRDHWRPVGTKIIVIAEPARNGSEHNGVFIIREDGPHRI